MTQIVLRATVDARESTDDLDGGNPFRPIFGSFHPTKY